jgi:uncharacterized protein
MPELPISLALGFGIGISLGLLGGGGSILTVPALVYIIGQTPQAAVTTSLAIVGANSMLGAYFHNTQGSLNWKVAIMFGGAGMSVAYLAAGLSGLFTPAALLILFAVLMIAISAVMLLQRNGVEQNKVQASWLVVIAAGAGVGLLTGILGVGGGFLIVPALVMLVGLPMYQAVGTSLVIIAANSIAGLLGHLGTSLFDLSLTLVFVVTGLAGTFIGSRLAKRMPAQLLKHIFAIFVLMLAIYLLADNLPKLGLG